jgi:hypothetical protein
MVSDLVIDALIEKNKCLGKNKSFEVDETFMKIARDTLFASEYWFLSAKLIISATNWDTSKLRSSDGSYRLPKACLTCYITQKNNYVIEWFPARQSDFLYFNNKPTGSSGPENRLVMIHDINALWYWLNHANKPDMIKAGVGRGEQYLANAIFYLTHNVKETLRSYVDIDVVSDLELVYDNPESMRNIIDMRIKDYRL